METEKISITEFRRHISPGYSEFLIFLKMSPATFENMFKITCITEMVVAKGEKTHYCDSMNN